MLIGRNPRGISISSSGSRSSTSSSSSKSSSSSSTSKSSGSGVVGSGTNSRGSTTYISTGGPNGPLSEGAKIALAVIFGLLGLLVLTWLGLLIVANLMERLEEKRRKDPLDTELAQESVPPAKKSSRFRFKLPEIFKFNRSAASAVPKPVVTDENPFLSPGAHDDQDDKMSSGWKAFEGSKCDQSLSPSSQSSHLPPMYEPASGVPSPSKHEYELMFPPEEIHMANHESQENVSFAPPDYRAPGFYAR
ncbi:hypothetical protein FRB98_007830 [Tulasnella sp. 332]|nr:hypothetical protein FRB98_007830 [Tulasnella sp. 332]